MITRIHKHMVPLEFGDHFITVGDVDQWLTCQIQQGQIAIWTKQKAGYTIDVESQPYTIRVLATGDNEVSTRGWFYIGTVQGPFALVFHVFAAFGHGS